MPDRVSRFWLLKVGATATLFVIGAVLASCSHPAPATAPLFRESSETVNPAISCQFRDTCIKEHHV